MDDVVVGMLALVCIVIGILLVGFTWHRAEIIGDDFGDTHDLGKCIFGGYGLLTLGVFLAFLAAFS